MDATPARIHRHSNGRKYLAQVFLETWRFFKATPYAISVIWKFQPRLLLLLVFTTVLDGLAPAITVVITRYLIDAVTAAFQHGGDMVYVKVAAYILALQVGVTVVLSLLGKGIFFLKSVLSWRLSLDMQMDLVGSMSRLDMKHYDDSGVYDMILRAMGEAQSNKPLAIISAACGVITNVITWFSFTALLFSFSASLVLAMIALCIPYLILNVYFGRANYRLQFDRTHEQREASYLSRCLADRRSLPEIITNDLWHFLQSKWFTLANRFMQQDRSLLRRRTISDYFLIVFTHIGRGAVSIFIIVKCLSRPLEHTVGQIMMYLQAFAGGVGSLGQVAQQLSSIYEGSCFLYNYQQFSELHKSSPTPKKRADIPKVIETIEFQNVSFKYPGAAADALENINVLFRRRESTLIVGRNGAGKTTLARLFVGLYAPTSGQILVNGIDMQEFDIRALRKRMSIIFQDFVRYALTAEENIGLGALEYLNDQERIVKAAKLAGVDNLLASLPKGYRTVLGREFRDGRDLSLGEWQRVCLARLFIRNASVTVYDEPSASLDVETESELLREISSLGKDRMCILISHRMLRSDIANRILVMDHGVIVENGSHEELVAAEGTYARLWNTYHRLGNDEEAGQDFAAEDGVACK